MRYVGIDEAINITGIAIIDENENLIFKHTIKSDISLSIWNRILNLISELSLYLEGDIETVVENVYYGKNVLSFKNVLMFIGALRYFYWQRYKKDILLLLATSARNLVGLNGRSTKAEIQYFILQKYNLGDVNFQKEIKKDLEILKTLKIKSDYEKFAIQISKKIELKTELTTHESDAILLALAAKRYYTVVKKETDNLTNSGSWNKGKTKESDNRLKRLGKSVSKYIKKSHNKDGNKNPMFGKSHKVESRQKMSNNLKGHIMTTLTKNKISKTMSKIAKEKRFGYWNIGKKYNKRNILRDSKGRYINGK